MQETKYANLIIAGVSKCGSTSLFSYLSAHPEVCGSNVKETQFFMPLKFGKPLPPMSEYQKFFTECANEKYRLDATPYYLWGNREIAEAIRRELGMVNIIFILRNPVTRSYSWYQHLRYHLMIPKKISFRDYLREAEKRMAADAKVWDIYSRGIQEGLYINSLPDWFNLFSDNEKNIKVLFFEDLKNAPQKVMNELCSWLDIDSSLIPENILKPENAGGTFRFQWFRELFLWARKNKKRLLLENKTMRKSLKKFEQKINKTSLKEKIGDEEKQYLENLYKPYNKQLHQFLLSKNYSSFPDWLE